MRAVHSCNSIAGYPSYHLDESVSYLGDRFQLARLYKSTGSYCCHPGVGVGVTFSGFTTLLCDGQGAVRRAILYANRFCFCFFFTGGEREGAIPIKLKA